MWVRMDVLESKQEVQSASERSGTDTCNENKRNSSPLVANRFTHSHRVLLEPLEITRGKLRGL